MKAEEFLLWLYLMALGLEDLKTKTVSRRWLIAGGAAGAVCAAAELLSGRLTPTHLLAERLPGLLPGFLLLLAGRFTADQVGKGDGLCFLSLSLWMSAERLFLLLLFSLLLCAAAGTVMVIRKKGGWKSAMPFLPFIWAAWTLQLLCEGIGAV